jgi:hypothetical protein
MALITGRTYPVRAALKALGGRWNARAQGWDVPSDKADEARALVAGGASGSSSTRAPRGSRYTRFSGGYGDEPRGVEVYTNRRGRCEDAPCCGCCS